MFRLESERSAGLVLEDTWEIAAYLPEDRSGLINNPKVVNPSSAQRDLYSEKEPRS